MRLHGLIRATAVALGLVLAASAPAAVVDTTGVPLPVTLGPGSVLWLEGTSTMHDFVSRTTELRIEWTRDPAAREPTSRSDFEAMVRASGIRGVDLRVPVRSLHSKKAALDKNLWKAMRADEHPEVRFRLTGYELAPGPGDTLVVRARGLLRITDKERPVALEARLHGADAGTLLEGSYTLLMSEYGIRPPKMMLGTLKVHDRITVRYRLLLMPAGGGGASGRNP